MGRWKRKISKYQLLEMLNLSDSYLLTPKLRKLLIDESWAWIPCCVLYTMCPSGFIINLLWWTRLQHSGERHAPCSASSPSKCLLPWAALFTWANGFGLSWPAHLKLQCLGRSCLSKPQATELWGDPQGNTSTPRELIDLAFPAVLHWHFNYCIWP